MLKGKPILYQVEIWKNLYELSALSVKSQHKKFLLNFYAGFSMIEVRLWKEI